MSPNGIPSTGKIGYSNSFEGGHAGSSRPAPGGEGVGEVGDDYSRIRGLEREARHRFEETDDTCGRATRSIEGVLRSFCVATPE